MARTTTERVCAAWRLGRPAEGSSVDTDGLTLRSWRTEVIGRTDADGAKTVLCCHCSQSTNEHCGTAAPFADRLVECPDHGRPDVHERSPRAAGARAGLSLRACPAMAVRTRGKAARLVRMFPASAVGCWYRCLACEVFHPNLRADGRPDPNESAREHWRGADGPNHVTARKG